MLKEILKKLQTQNLVVWEDFPQGSFWSGGWWDSASNRVCIMRWHDDPEYGGWAGEVAPIQELWLDGNLLWQRSK